MSISAYIKVIGRGKDGARPLTAEQAHDLMSQVLADQVTDLEVGAFCLAMRIKGEEVNELDGFVRATLAHCLPIPSAPSGVVVLPSYNGARKLPNLTPLLALQLAQHGVAVLVHGPRHDPTRVTTAQVFDALGLPTATSAQDVQDAWQAGRPAFMDIATLCPPLAKLLDVRWTIGLRNPGHTVAKLLDPILATEGSRTMRVVNHTHPEYAISLNAYLKHAQANALLMRGTEGEPVADPRRQPRFEVFINGLRDEGLSRAPVDGVLTELPELPNGFDADTTARYIESLMSGQQPLPAAIAAQVSCLRQALIQA
ncbi:DNA-binding protein YbiB [Aquabacterium sp.]|uniref:DNA-binding protein YbiB n=1 Tax=Aquabacterium sp. TaxID=1872578 RepID=UPI0019A1680F|nr:DNA-binding protein YbiB [Aquabacterium sp.]MBC7699353.1 DNA-binding protein YbiB [Aquabacterium sp.]